MSTIFDQLLEHAGVPALMLAFAAVVWVKTEANAQGIRDLWSIVNGKDGHSEKIAKIEGRLGD